MNVALSVIVCTYNREELLRLCLQSLAEQSLDRGLYEVVIVDNNSTRAARDIAQSFEERYDNFRVVTEARQGLSHARNRGWSEARGEFVAFLDDDAKATPQWCERILRAFHEVQPPPVAVGGEIRPFYDSMPPSWFSDDFEIRTWGDSPGFLQPPRAKDGFSGSNMAFRSDIFTEFGGFSTDLGMKGEVTALGEETELFTRVYRKYPLFWYDPQMLVFHWTSRRNMTIYYRLLRNYKGGESLALIQQRRILSGPYLLTWLAVLYFIASTPFALLSGKSAFRTEAVRRGEELAGRMGYLLGRAASKSG